MVRPHRISTSLRATHFYVNSTYENNGSMLQVMATCELYSISLYRFWLLVSFIVFAVGSVHRLERK